MSDCCETAISGDWGSADGSSSEDEDEGWILVNPTALVSDSVAHTPDPGFDPSRLGFHAAALLLRCGIFEGASLATERTSCCAYLKASLSAKFPIAKDAPRLAEPSVRSADGFYTPYFQTFTFDAMLQAGRGGVGM